MKKLLVLVSCFAVMLILNKVSIAQGVAAGETGAVPSSVAASEFPFGYPHFSSQSSFGSRLADRRADRQAAVRILTRDPAVMPVSYPYGIADLRPSAVRRVARLTQPPQPPRVQYQPYPVMVPSATGGVVPSDSEAGTDSTFAPGAVAQWGGGRNTLVQRSTASSPVINALSVVRGAPRYFDAAYSTAVSSEAGSDSAASATGSTTFTPGAVVQVGKKNVLVQRSKDAAPVINFGSVVRGAPRYFDAAYPVPAKP